MTTPGPIVLVGGGGLGPWAWNRVTPLLQQHGLTVVTPQLRATGNDETLPSSIALSDWIDDLATEVGRLEGVTLVAHSFAGYVAAGALHRIAGHLRSVIFLDAVLPQPSASWFEVMGSRTEDFMRSVARDGATPWFTRDQLDQMYPNNGITDQDLAWLHEHVTSQPIGTYAEHAIEQPIQTLAANVRLHYVRCLRTNPPVAPDTDSTDGWIMSTIDSSHWPMVTAPEDVARAIIKVVENP
ncbi:esterase [Luteimicrobium album]|uniref:Esterase n=1 Tax=Luteimicrobium album TaxID=1054550 RepID=A0ABQ6I4C7_9MICO|nr:alpha/beta hydrolase [Luteimicrobium album]GMA25614.1 esterase [Luteimicrobium album]